MADLEGWGLEPDPDAQSVRHLKSGVALVWIPGGSFEMGSDDGAKSQGPRHTVTLDGFYLGREAVTYAEFNRYLEATGASPPPTTMGSAGRVEWGKLSENPDRAAGLLRHSDAVAYAAWAGASLPTEAQWEYAARGAFGLESMGGRVSEWCSDVYSPTYYGISPASNPTGPDEEEARAALAAVLQKEVDRLLATSPMAIYGLTPQDAEPPRVIRCGKRNDDEDDHSPPLTQRDGRKPSYHAASTGMRLVMNCALG